jgi:hypothetical protein
MKNKLLSTFPLLAKMKPTLNQIITLVGTSMITLMLGYGLGSMENKPLTASVSESSEIKEESITTTIEIETKPELTDGQLPLDLISTKTDVVTDLTTYTLRIPASTPGYNSIGSREDASIFVRCEVKDLEVLVTTPEFLSSDPQAVQIRWGSDQPQSQGWSGSSGGSALFSEAPRSFLTKAISQESFAISYKPWRTVDTSAKFELTNYKNLLTEMKRVCS